MCGSGQSTSLHAYSILEKIVGMYTREYTAHVAVGQCTSGPMLASQFVTKCLCNAVHLLLSTCNYYVP